MTKWYIGRRRLQKLADHLKNGKLSVTKFDFSIVRDEIKKGYADSTDHRIPSNFCGTLGCAIGELPKVFPRIFSWTGHTYWMEDAVCLKSNRNVGDFQAAEKFFGLRNLASSLCSESDQLFVPNTQLLPCLKRLNSAATKHQVARNIERYIKWRDKEEAKLVA